MDATSAHVPPRLTVFRPAAGEAVVSIVSCDAQDFGRGVWTTGTPQPDELISADGTTGRLAQVLAAGGPAVFHTHWQTIYSHGTRAGLHALDEVARRLDDHCGERVIWTRCSDLAAYAAAAAAVQITTEVGEEGATTLTVTTPFPCDRFTLSLRQEGPPRAVTLDGVPLARATPKTLAEGHYAVEQGTTYLCWALRDTQRLTLQPA